MNHSASRLCRSLSGASLLVYLAAFVGGCQSGYRESSKKLDAALVAGDMPAAANLSYNEYKKDATGRDHVVCALDAGPVLLLAGRPADSCEALTSAYETVRPYLDTKADDSVSEGVATTVVNQTLAEYKGTPVERVLMNTVLAVGQMVNGDAAAARIELNRANDWQQDARNRYASSIAAEQAASSDEAKKKGIDLDKAMQTPGLSKLSEGLDADAGPTSFQSSWTSYLRAVFLTATSREAGDLSTARTELRGIWETCPTARPVIEADLACLDSGDLHKTTWVFAFTGLCPRREELRLDIPIPVGNVNYVSAAFPLLKPVDGATTQFSISTANDAVQASLLMDVEAVVKAEYKQKLPAIIAQEILSCALKAAATYAAKQSSSNSTTSAILQITGIVYQAASTSADLRAWRSLPKYIYVARIATPESGTVTVSVPGGPAVQVTVDPAANNGVVVWHTQPASKTISSVSWSMR